jgi:hypothetical protein
VAGALRERLGGGDDAGGDWGGGDDRPPAVEVEPDFGLSGARARTARCCPLAVTAHMHVHACVACADARVRAFPARVLAPTGALAAETNTVNGVTLLYQEPPEARMPSKRWRLYVFKGDAEACEPLLLHKQTHYLVGRERRVASIPTDHPSCSKQARQSARGLRRRARCPCCERSLVLTLFADAWCACDAPCDAAQHAALQWRLTEKMGADGMPRAATRLYIMARAAQQHTRTRIPHARPHRLHARLCAFRRRSTRTHVSHARVSRTHARRTWAPRTAHL